MSWKCFTLLSYIKYFCVFADCRKKKEVYKGLFLFKVPSLKFKMCDGVKES